MHVYVRVGAWGPRGSVRPSVRPSENPSRHHHQRRSHRAVGRRSPIGRVLEWEGQGEAGIVCAGKVVYGWQALEPRGRLGIARVGHYFKQFFYKASLCLRIHSPILFNPFLGSFFPPSWY